MQQNLDDKIAKISTNSEKKYRLVGLLVIWFALLIRLFDLGDRVFHWDEGMHGRITLELLAAGQYTTNVTFNDPFNFHSAAVIPHFLGIFGKYTYDPAYHGPFLFHSTAIIFHFLGINDTTARLIPVLFGVATIPLIFLLEKELGKSGVLWSAFLLAFSPSMVYYSRFFRNDMIIVFCTLATVAGGVRYLENLHSRKRYPYLILAASSLAIAVSSKENAYLIILMFGAYGGIYLLYKFYSDWKKENLSLKKALRLKSSAFFPFLPEILLSGVLFFFIVMLFYTSLFRNDITPFSIVEKAFSHWMEMHKIQRLGGPFNFYIPILLVYESPILFFGIMGIIHYLKKKDKNAPFFLFLSYWAVVSLLLYSYLQEKVPWLVVHIVLPFGILAGAYLGEFFPKMPDDRQQKQIYGAENRSSEFHTLLAGILVLTLIISLFHCISINFYSSMDSNEKMIYYGQGSPDVRGFMEKIEGFNQGPGTLKLLMVVPDQYYWPLPWYLRDYKQAYYSTYPPKDIKYDAVILPAEYQRYDKIPEEEYASYSFTLISGRDFTLYYNKKLEKSR